MLPRCTESQTLNNFSIATVEKTIFLLRQVVQNLHGISTIMADSIRSQHEAGLMLEGENPTDLIQ
jgi:hypothetical protein